MADGFSLEDFSGTAPQESPAIPSGQKPFSLEEFAGDNTETDNSDQFLRSIEHGASFGLSEKIPSRETPEAIARFEKFKTEHPWINATGNLLGGAGVMVGLPLVAAAAPEAVTAGIADAAAPITAAAGRLVAPVTRGIEAARTYAGTNFIDPLVNAGKAVLTGAGFGAAYGAGDSKEGHRVADILEGAKTGAEFAPVAQLGTEGALSVLGGAKKLAEPFVSPMTTARRVFQRQFPDTEIPPIPPSVPGFKPTMGQATGDPSIQSFERQALPGNSEIGGDNLASRLDEQRSAVASAAALPTAKPSDAVNAVKSGVNDEISAYQQRAQTETANAQQALNDSAGYSEYGLPGLTPQDASVTARAQLDGIQQYYRDQESAKWNALDAPNLTVKTWGKFKNGVGDFYASLPEYAKGDNNPELESLYESVKGLNKEVPFDQIQQIRSDALKIARGLKTTNPFKAGVLNDFADSIHSSVDEMGGLTPESKAAWVAARDATKDRYERFGNSLIGKYVGDDNAGAAARAPSMTLQNILTGPGSADKFGAMLKAVTPEGGTPNAGVINSVKQYIASDIADKVGADVVNPKAVTTALLKYRPVISQSPELQAAFDNVADAQQAAFAARQLAEERTDVIQKSAAAKFSGADAGDPASVNKAVGSILGSKTPRQDAMDIASRMNGDADAMNGMRRVLVDRMMDGSADPHEFIANNRSVLNVFFPEKEQQAMLDNVADASRQTATSAAAPTGRNEPWKELNSDHGYLGALVGKTTARGAKVAGAAAGAGVGAIAAASGLAEHLPIVGEIMGHASGPVADAIGATAGVFGTGKLLNTIYKAPREKVVQLIKDGLLDPDGVGRKLTKPVSEVNSREVAKYIVPGVVANAVGDKTPQTSVTGYAEGGRIELDKSKRLLRHVHSTFPLKRAG